MNARRSDLQIILFLVSGLWLTTTFIGPGYEGIKHNALIRMAATFSIVRDGSLQVDQEAPFSRDKAYFEGHYYSDKAPGMTLMATPVVAIVEGIAHLAGVDTAPVQAGKLSNFLLLAAQVATAFTSGVAFVLLVAAIYMGARGLGLSQSAAAFGSLCYGIGTPAFGWATMFFGHIATGSCLYLAFAVIHATTPTDTPSRRLILRGLAVGGLLGWACVIEYTTAAPALIVAIYGLGRLRNFPRADVTTMLVGVVAGGAVAVIPLAIYDQVAFGSPWRIGYQFVVGFDEMKQGSMGFSLPKAWVAWEILFGSFRGMLWLSPLLAVLPFAWYAAWRRFPGDTLAVLVGVPILYVIINAGYFDWSGAASTGPRHLVPALAFIGLPFAFLWDTWSRPALRGVLLALLALSSAISVACAAVTMASPNLPSEPMLPFLLAKFAAGDVHNLFDFVMRGGFDWHPSGRVHLLTLLLLLVPWLVAFGIARMVGRRDALGDRSSQPR